MYSEDEEEKREEEEFIKNNYGGDRARYERAFYRSVKEQTRKVLYWDQLALAATTFPELEEEAHKVIIARLGYLPEQKNLIVKYEPQIRALIQFHKKGNISDEDYKNQIEELVKLIRNKEVDGNTCIFYDKDVYANYEKNYYALRQPIRNRLTKLLGYEPNLEHSLIVEMYMQTRCPSIEVLQSEEITALDLQAITHIRYREVLLKDGIEAADNSPLYGLENIV